MYTHQKNREYIIHFIAIVFCKMFGNNQKNTSNTITVEWIAFNWN